MKFTAQALMLLFFGFGVQAQTVYKCGNTYSQTMCAHDAPKVDTRPALSHGSGGYTAGSDIDSVKAEMLRVQKLIDSLPPSIPLPADAIEVNKARCKARILAMLKDPESARISEVIRATKASPDYETSKGWFPSMQYTVDVNAKNSYGGYTGSKMWVCSFDLKEKELVRAKAFD